MENYETWLREFLHSLTTVLDFQNQNIAFRANNEVSWEQILLRVPYIQIFAYIFDNQCIEGNFSNDFWNH